jgi:hypothetical protein
MMAAIKRFDRRLSILVSEAEHAMLAEVAAHRGLTPSDVVRQCIRHEHAQLPKPLDTKPKPKRKR